MAHGDNGAFKLVIDATFLFTVIAAILYFAGTLYYTAFDLSIGLPIPDFMPSSQAVMGQAAFKLMLAFPSWGMVAVLIAAVVALAVRVAVLERGHKPGVWQKIGAFSNRVQKWVIGWPILAVLLTIAAASVWTCTKAGRVDALNRQDSFDAVPMTVTLKRDAGGIAITGRLIASSPDFLAVYVDRSYAKTTVNVPMLIRKDSILTIEDHQWINASK